MHRLVPSPHFLDRSAQRNLSPKHIAFALQHGRVLHRTGIRFYFLGRRDIPEKLRRDSDIAHLEGLTVLLTPEGTLITTYKNPRALRKIRRKPKRTWRTYPA